MLRRDLMTEPLTRLSLALALGAIMSGYARPVLADEVSDSCIAAHVDGQVLVQGEKLVAARERFSSCTLDACPSMIRRECAELAAQLEQRIPTLVFSATGGDLRPLAEARVELDGRLVQTKLDGRALRVDPGRHDVRVSAEGAIRELTIRRSSQGKEPARRSLVRRRYARERRRLCRGSRRERLFTRCALRGVRGRCRCPRFVRLLRASGKSLEDDLEGCKPNCENSDVDRMQASYLVADISLGVSIVSLGVGTYLLLTRESSKGPSVSAVSAVIAPDSVGFSAAGRF